MNGDLAPVVSLWCSLALGAIVAYPIYLLLIRLKSRQTVSEFVPEHQKKQGTPTMGGLIIVVGSIFGMLVASNRSALTPMIVLVLSFALIGFVDDFVVPRLLVGKRGLGWKQKILLQLAVAAGVSALDGMATPLALGGTVFSILLYSNAYNFADGLDGLAGSVGIFFLVPLSFIGTLSTGRAEIATVSLAIVGSIVPFLMLNAPPAKVFMGDVGSLPVGAAIGLAIAELFRYNTAVTPVWLDLAVLALSLVLLAELVPPPLQIASVKLRKKRLFLRTPIHHGFEARGWPETRIVWRFAMVQLICGAAALSIIFVATHS